MKTQSKLALSLVLIAMPLALRATTFEETYLEHYRPYTAEPAPIAIVVPRVDSEFIGKEFTLKFVVDPSGRARHIASTTPGTDPQLVREVANAVAWWRFNPGYRDGKPVARHVELPVSVVPGQK
jgi:hypothetical protein